MNINVINYAINCHTSTNHLYDGKPYVLHLSMVVQIANNFIELVPEQVKNDVIAACWLHDVIEDCRQTYNDVKQVAGERVADIVYALSNEKGKTRLERANAKYYKGIRDTAFATFVKLCDRIANVVYSKHAADDRMFKMYQKEHEHFIEQLRPNRIYSPMVGKISSLLNIEQNDERSVASKDAQKLEP
jgi:(p)ppGpp synthase/HD superfamily hydrolase